MKPANLLTKIFAFLTMVFLYLPLVGVAVYSVNAAEKGLLWEGFTLNWYHQLFEDEYILQTAWNTLELALVSTLIATFLGTLVGIGINRFPWSRKASSTLDVLLHIPVVTPDIIMAGALVVAFKVLSMISGIFEPGMTTMIIGHVTFQIAFVALVVKSRLASIGHDVEEAARDLFASNWYVMRRVMLPLMLPGIVAGAMLAFTLSLDDFVLSFFTSGPDSQTLPLYIYAAVRKGVTPEIHALSTLVVLLTVIMVIGAERIGRKKEA